MTSAQAGARTPGPAPPRPSRATPAAATQSAAQPGAFTLLYGDDHCFGIVPPNGWMVDDSSGLGAKIRVVLYPKGSTWATAGTVMYFNPMHRERALPTTLTEKIARDVADFRRNVPRGKVESAPALKTAAGKPAEVRYFTGPGGIPREAVAYVLEKDIVMLIVMSSREIGGFDAALPAWRSVVGSYRLIADNIDTPTR